MTRELKSKSGTFRQDCCQDCVENRQINYAFLSHVCSVGMTVHFNFMKVLQEKKKDESLGGNHICTQFLSEHMKTASRNSDKLQQLEKFLMLCETLSLTFGKSLSILQNLYQEFQH